VVSTLHAVVPTTCAASPLNAAHSMRAKISCTHRHCSVRLSIQQHRAVEIAPFLPRVKASNHSHASLSFRKATGARSDL
jgi:hypothetical protein